MKKALETLLEDNQGNITQAVIEEALSYDTPKAFFEDLLQHGCISWMVSSLIYYKDTHEFYDKHYAEIEDIRCQLADDWIEVKFPECSDLKNFYAWLSFEQRAYELQNTLEMDGR